MVAPLLTILISLSLAYVLSEIFKFLKLPRVVGQVLAGIILGLGPLRLLLFSGNNYDVLSFLANLGVVLLFYYIGLEMDLKSFRSKANKSFIISFFKGVTPLLIGFLVMRYFLNLDILASLVVGIALSAGAQSVSVDLLEELKMLKTKIGSLLVGIGVITDLFELLLVSLLFASFPTAELTINGLLFGLFLFLLIVIVARVWFVPYTFRLFRREDNSTSRFMGALIIALLLVSLSEFLGVGALIGAFIAGIIVRQSILKDINIPDWEEHDIARSIHIVAFGFLIPLFFVWVGLNTRVTFISEYYGLVLLFLGIAVVGTVGGTVLGGWLSKERLKESWTLGWGLSPKGDIGFVLGALSLQAGVIEENIFTSLVLMALVVTIIAPIVFEKMVLKREKNGH